MVLVIIGTLPTDFQKFNKIGQKDFHRLIKLYIYIILMKWIRLKWPKIVPNLTMEVATITALQEANIAVPVF